MYPYELVILFSPSPVSCEDKWAKLIGSITLAHMQARNQQRRTWEEEGRAVFNRNISYNIPPSQVSMLLSWWKWMKLDYFITLVSRRKDGHEDGHTDRQTENFNIDSRIKTGEWMCNLTQWAQRSSQIIPPLFGLKSLEWCVAHTLMLRDSASVLHLHMYSGTKTHEVRKPPPYPYPLPPTTITNRANSNAGRRSSSWSIGKDNAIMTHWEHKTVKTCLCWEWKKPIQGWHSYTVSMMPQTVPFSFPGQDCPKFRFGFIKVLSSANHWLAMVAALSAYWTLSER